MAGSARRALEAVKVEGESVKVGMVHVAAVRSEVEAIEARVARAASALRAAINAPITVPKVFYGDPVSGVTSGGEPQTVTPTFEGREERQEWAAGVDVAITAAAGVLGPLAALHDAFVSFGRGQKFPDRVAWRPGGVDWQKFDAALWLSTVELPASPAAVVSQSFDVPTGLYSGDGEGEFPDRWPGPTEELFEGNTLPLVPWTKELEWRANEFQAFWKVDVTVEKPGSGGFLFEIGGQGIFPVVVEERDVCLVRDGRGIDRQLVFAVSEPGTVTGDAPTVSATVGASLIVNERTLLFMGEGRRTAVAGFGVAGVIDDGSGPVEFNLAFQTDGAGTDGRAASFLGNAVGAEGDAAGWFDGWHVTIGAAFIDVEWVRAGDMYPATIGEPLTGTVLADVESEGWSAWRAEAHAMVNAWQIRAFAVARGVEEAFTVFRRGSQGRRGP